MTAGDLCTRTARTVPPDATVREAARCMRCHDVSTLVVVDGDGPMDGIVTDRDLVVRVLAADLDPTATPVRRVMTRGPAAVEAGVSVEQAFHVMADHGVRRLVVLGPDGSLGGVLSYDDLLAFLAGELDPAGRLLDRRPRL